MYYSNQGMHLRVVDDLPKMTEGLCETIEVSTVKISQRPLRGNERDTKF